MRYGLVVAALASAAPAGAAGLVAVPTISCPSDGQLGPQAAPRRWGSQVRLARETGARLALYESSELRVLAPRGWHCLQLSGSDGAILIVTPERHRLEDMHDLRGPAVQLGLSYGGTSGRIAVAEAIARLFPDHMHFAEQVEAEGILDRPFARGAFPDDRLERVSGNVVRFTTPGGKQGIGTVSRLVPASDPIQGVAILLDHEDGPDLLQVSIRLPRGDSQLASSIIDQVSGRSASAMRR